MRRRPVARSLSRRAAAVLLAALAVVLAGCGSGTATTIEAAPSDPGPELRQLRVGVIPIIDVAPLYLGIKKGYFEEQGIEVVPVTADSGARIAEGVLTGEVDIGFSNVVSLLALREKGQPIVALAAGTSSTGNPDNDVNAVLVGKDSPIRRARDLAGRRVAVNAPNNIGDVTVRVAVEKDGGDPADIEFVVMPFPEMPAALAEGEVDAVWVSEPFVTAIEAAGGRALFDNLTETYEKVQIALWFTTSQRLAEDRALLKDFTDAINNSMLYTRDHQTEARTILTTYTKIPVELTRTANLPDWPIGLDEDSAQAVGEAARRYGVLTKEPDVDGLFGR